MKAQTKRRKPRAPRKPRDFKVRGYVIANIFDGIDRHAIFLWSPGVTSDEAVRLAAWLTEAAAWIALRAQAPARKAGR